MSSKLYEILDIILCLILFTYYFYDISFVYFKYRTNTSINYRALPKFIFTLNLSHQKGVYNTTGMEVIKTLVKINEREPEIGYVSSYELNVSRVAQLVGYRAKVVNTDKYGEDLIFILKPEVGIFFQEKSIIVGNKDATKVIEVPMGFVKYQHVLGHIITVISLLESPYDTNCRIFKDQYGNGISKGECYKICSENLLHDECERQCTKKSCLLYSSNVQLTMTSAKRRIIGETIFGTGFLTRRNMKMESVPAISTTLYIFYSLGLLSTFVDFSIVSILLGISKFIGVIILKTEPHISCRIVVWMLSSVLCLCHIFYVTTDYLNYNHDSQVYLGSPVSFQLPQFLLCKSENETEDIDKIITNISFPFTKSISTTDIEYYNHEKYQFYGLNCIRIESPNISLSSESMQSTDQIMWMVMKHRRKPTYLYVFDGISFSINKMNGFLFSTEDRGFEVATSFTSSSLLRSPFSTHCLDYQGLGSTRQQCIEQCAKSNTSERYCNRRICRPECDNIEWYSVAGSSSGIDCIINFPETIQNVTLIPSIYLVDFIAGILSVISFWVGICIFTSFVDVIEWIIKRFKTRCVKLILHTFIFIGLLLHSFIIVENYLEYQIVSNVNYQIPNILEYPKVTIVLHEIFGSGKVNASRMSPKELNLTFSSLEESILNVSIALPDTDEFVNLDELQRLQFFKYSVHEKIFGEDKFLTLDFANFMNRADIANFRDRTSLLLYTIKLYDFIPHLNSGRYLTKLQAHYMYNDIYLYDNFKSHSHPTDTALYVMRTELLKSPYDTNCKKYPKDPYKVKNSWYSCLLDKYNNSLPNDLVANADEGRKRHKPTNADARNRMECLRKYRYYTPCSMYSMKYSAQTFAPPVQYVPGRENVIRIFLTSFITCTLHPKTTFIQLFIIIGGVIGTWLGINLYSLLIMASNGNKFWISHFRKQKVVERKLIHRIVVNERLKRRTYVERKTEIRKEFNEYLRRERLIYMFEKRKQLDNIVGIKFRH